MPQLISNLSSRLIFLFQALLVLTHSLLVLTHSLLVLLKITRPNEWEPPTLLDSLFFSPLLYLTSKIYLLILFLRGQPFRPPPHHSPIRVHKVVIAGNHDCFLDPASSIHRAGLKEKRKLDWKGVVWLQDELVTLEFDDRVGNGKRKLNVFGSSWVPRCGGDDFAFQYPHEKPPWEGKIPLETDVLITHCPPKGHLDLLLGCPALLSELWRVKPKLHVFGHIHHEAGVESVFFDECQASYESLLLRVVDALNVLRYGLQSVLWKWIMAGPGSNNGGVLVNAGVMRGNTGRLRKGREVVKVVDL
ncbi:hypothetical protein B0T21DRAFT_402538 [Apiosordaria backusii]|uniref:Calcineurin-like phosphoesterase domain-containing protein n=1 Tax=Apiosordaria backusii TaxID=314023 RepID=A0AA40BKH5_9PEZI|nr:hypothetical protein B0T21DRAFT_402538 [Apiosordaria backusii]